MVSIRSQPLSVALGNVIHSLADGVVVAGRDGRCLLFNPAARRLLGMDPTEVSASEWTSAFGVLLPDLVTPCPSKELPLVRALQGEAISNLELFVLNQGVPDGVWLSLNATPVLDARGEIEGAAVVLRDITARKEKLKKIELLSNVVEVTADAVVITDRRGRIEYVNPAFETATGYSRAEALGSNPSILKSGAHPNEFYAGLWKTLVEGRVFRGMFVNRKKNGELYFAEQTITPVRGPGGAIAHVVSVGKDVTQLRRAAERETSLLLARSVQQRLLPSGPPAVPGFDVYGATFEADVTGGDYYDFIPLPGERLGVLVADVSGHGVDSALLMAETRAVLRAAAQTTSDASEILAVVNRVLHADTEAHRFATLLLASLHAPTGSLSYASAGHTSGYLLDGRGAVRAELSATGLPLGMFSDSRYETRTLPGVEPGDTLVLLTDGVTDCGLPEEELFGTERALEAIRSALGGRAAALAEELHRAVRAFERGGPQRDDVTMVVVRCLPRV